MAAVAVCGLLVASASAAPPASTGASSGAQRVHEVSGGDTLTSVAQRYGVSVAALVAANGFRNDRATLRLRQRLVIPSSAAAAGKAALHRRTPRRPRDASPRASSVRAPADFFFAVPDFADALTSFIWPAEGVVTSPFGRRRLGWHRGIDIQGERGEPIIAAATGVVVVSGVEPRYGRVVKIEHEHGFITVYAHNDDNHVEIGDRVLAGQRIASIGQTGRATSYHLHFEIRRDGRVYNPLYMLPLPARVSHVTEIDDDGPDD